MSSATNTKRNLGTTASKHEQLGQLRLLVQSTSSIATHLGVAAEELENANRSAAQSVKVLSRWNQAFSLAAAAQQ
jgi:hypothetical protein